MVFHCDSSRQTVSWCADDVWQCKIISGVVTKKSLCAITVSLSVLIVLFCWNKLASLNARRGAAQ